MKQINSELKEPSNKQTLKEQLKDVKTIYVVFLNKQHTKMNLYYVKDGELEEVWISPVDTKDKPLSWGKSGIYQERTYCFKYERGGIDTKDGAVRCLYKWLGLENIPKTVEL